MAENRIGRTIKKTTVEGEYFDKEFRKQHFCSIECFQQHNDQHCFNSFAQEQITESRMKEEQASGDPNLKTIKCGNENNYRH